MNRGFISDAHGNAPGLRAAIAALRGAGVDEIYCLGDTVGYAPEPDVCLDIVRRECAVVLRGNHDHAVLDNSAAEFFNSTAKEAVVWTRSYLESKGGDYLSYLDSLSPHHEEDDLQFVHGSPVDHMDEYVFPQDIYEDRKIARVFSRIKRGAFAGHTHMPGLFMDWGGNITFHTPADLQMRYELPTGKKFLVNVGSCGQPRDYEVEACCCVYDGTQVRWLRAAYDIEEVVRKVEAIPELANTLGTRLREGR